MKQRRAPDADEYETWDMQAMFTGKGHADGSPWIAVECLKAQAVSHLRQETGATSACNALTGLRWPQCVQQRQALAPTALVR